MSSMAITLILLALVFIWKCVIPDVKSKNEETKKAEESVNENKIRADKIRTLENTKYTEKQLARINAIESSIDRKGMFAFPYPHKVAAKDKELLGVIIFYTGEDCWLAIYEDEVLPSKELTEEYHIYPVARKDFTKYYSLFINQHSSQESVTSSYTYTPSKASTTKRAVAGAIIGGGVGAVIGAASAIDKNSRAPETRYRTTNVTHKNYRLAFQTAFYDQSGNLNTPCVELSYVKIYINNNTYLKQITPKSAKTDRKHAYLDENDKSTGIWVDELFVDCESSDLPYLQEASKVCSFVLDTY